VVAEKLVRETPVEFFREQLTKAMDHQKVATSAFTEYYLVNLLTNSVRGDLLPPPEPGLEETPLAVMYVRAMQASRVERARLLRAMGDSALFVSGFFAESLQNKIVDLAYYRAMGGRAYARLSQETSSSFAPAVFDELSERFGQFADVLWEVSENSRMQAGSHSVVALYERWLQTKSRRSAELLAERGIDPVSPVEGARN
jgi:hypothetical protein